MGKIYERPCNFCKKLIRYPNKKEFTKSECINKKCRKCRVNSFLSFDDAKKIVNSLNIKDQDSWTLWIKSEEGKKYNIPSNPDKFYKHSGWISYSDWLGNNSYKNLRNIKYLDYNSCKNYIMSNFPSIINRNKWIELDKLLLPINIPKRPDVFYKYSGWINWESFLNSKLSPRSKSKVIIDFNEAKDYVRKNDIRSESEYYYHIESNGILFLPLRPDHKYKNEWNGFIDFLGVKSLRKSTGEDRIEDVLNSYKIKYTREKIFDTCRNIRRLPFDFYLSELNICIEYDGEFHYKEQKHFGVKKVLERVQINDKIKDKWCIENNILLIRISYKDKWRIRNILEKKLVLI